jgi:hypothetical protein
MSHTRTEKSSDELERQAQESVQPPPHVVDMEKVNTIPSPTVNDNRPNESTEKSNKNKDDKTKLEEPKISYFQLYRFADTWDWICLL